MGIEKGMRKKGNGKCDARSAVGTVGSDPSDKANSPDAGGRVEGAMGQINRNRAREPHAGRGQLNSVRARNFGVFFRWCVCMRRKMVSSIRMASRM